MDEKLIDEALMKIRNELISSFDRSPEYFISAHEGYAVLLGEIDEMWDEIKQGLVSSSALECIKVGAMAVKYIMSIHKQSERKEDSPDKQVQKPQDADGFVIRYDNMREYMIANCSLIKSLADEIARLRSVVNEEQTEHTDDTADLMRRTETIKVCIKVLRERWPHHVFLNALQEDVVGLGVGDDRFAIAVWNVLPHHKEEMMTFFNNRIAKPMKDQGEKPPLFLIL